MKCFRHPGVDAVAMCKHCAKALCAGCAAEGKGGISCGSACAEEYFLLICGAAMLVLGLMSDETFPIAMGSIFLFCGLVGVFTARKFPKP